MGLTLADVDRWQPDAVQAAGDDLLKRGTSVEALKDSLRKLPFIGRWQGQAGPAAEESIDKVARYLMDHNDALQAAGKAMQKSAADIWLVKKALTAAEDEADAGHFTIDKATGTVTPKNKDCDPQTLADIKTKVQQVLALADTADAELAHATKLVTGDAAPGDPSGITTPTGAQTGEAVDYAQRSRDKDLATVAANANSPEGQAATARLRDYNTLTNPAAGADAKKFAAERLNDFRSAQFVGPQERDNVFGRTPAQRAQARLNMQRLLESPEFKGKFTPDQVTRVLDTGEAGSRSLALKEIESNLQKNGMSYEGAHAAAGALEHGATPEQLLNSAAKAGGAELSSFGEATKYVPDNVPQGRHWQEGIKWSPEDMKALESVGKRAGAVGTLIDFASRLDDIANGAPVGDTALRFGGSFGGTMLGAWVGAKACMIGGPEAAAVCGLLGGIGGGWAGEEGVNKVLEAVEGK